MLHPLLWGENAEHFLTKLLPERPTAKLFPVAIKINLLIRYKCVIFADENGADSGPDVSVDRFGCLQPLEKMLKSLEVVVT